MQSNKKRISIPVAIFVFGIVIWYFSQPKSHEVNQSVEPMVEVIVPNLSATAKLGEEKFNQNCASCHGVNAAGQKGHAPPLIHKIYEPSHHTDESFWRAVSKGVYSHHWRFGNMPAIKSLNQDEVDTIIAYIREVQRANGIN